MKSKSKSNSELCKIQRGETYKGDSSNADIATIVLQKPYHTRLNKIKYGHCQHVLSLTCQFSIFHNLNLNLDFYK